MNADVKEIVVNGVEYVVKGQESSLAKKLDGNDYVIVRTYSAGVFAGYVDKKDGKEITLLKARRLWYWNGAASLSQLAMEGVSCPSDCKFPCEVDEIILTEAVEVIKCTEKARISIKEVKIWKD